jgi:glycine oxidase
MISVAGEAHGGSTPEGEFALHASSLWPDFAREVEEASGVDLAYARAGALILTPHGDPFPTNADGVEPIDRARVETLAPMLTREWRSAFLAKNEAQVDNRRLGEALATAFERSGGTLLRHEPAIRIEIVGNRAVGVRTALGAYAAEIILLAAGAWSSEIDGLPRDAVPPVVPVKGQMVAFEPPDAPECPRLTIWGNDVYLVPRHGRLLIGATAENCGFDTGTTKEAAAWLTSHAVELIPGLPNWRFVEHWAGLRPGSPDGLPMLGPTIVEGLYAATGQFRNGILFAPAIAELMAGILLRSETTPASFDPRRFVR